jgi:hypothetical protein
LAYQAAQNAVPDLLKGLLADITGEVSKLDSAFTAAFGGLDCPILQSYDADQFSKFPGSKTS